MTIRYVEMDVAALQADAENPRTITPQAMAGLERSIARFGLVQPIVLNETTGKIVAGHQRLEVLRKHGVKTTMVAVGSWSEDEQRVLNVALNNPGIQGEFTNATKYLEGALRGVSLSDFRTLQLDSLFPRSEKAEKGSAAGNDLSYRLLIICAHEEQQAELLDELTDRGLEVKPLIV